MRLRCTVLLVGIAVVALACFAKFSFESSIILQILGPRQARGASRGAVSRATSAGSTAAGLSSEFARRVSLLSATSAAAFKEVAALHHWSAKGFVRRYANTRPTQVLCPTTTTTTNSNDGNNNCAGSGSRAQSQGTSQPGPSDRPQTQVTKLPGATDDGAHSQSQVADEVLPSSLGGMTGGSGDRASVPVGDEEERPQGGPLWPADLICRDETPHSRNFRKGEHAIHARGLCSRYGVSCLGLHLS